MPCTSVDLGLTRLEVPPGDRGRWAGFGYLHKTASLGPPWFIALVLLFRDSPPRTQLPTILLEPLVSGNLVNRFFVLPGPHARTPFPFHRPRAAMSNGHRENLRVRSLEDCCRGFSLESHTLAIGSTWDRRCTELQVNDPSHS